MTDHIDIVFDGPPEHVAGRFVEVEDANGQSIAVGTWIQDGNLWRLRIPDHRALPALLDEVERLREQCEHPEDFCGCTMNRTGEEMTATCEWHTYPTTFAEKSATMAALAALREQLEKKDV